MLEIAFGLVLQAVTVASMDSSQAFFLSGHFGLSV
jgi:hypothetical protein